jgi:hypothetical protein
VTAQVRSRFLPRSTIWRALFAVIGAASVLAAAPVAAQSPRVAEPATRITVRAQPLAGFEARDGARRQFGALQFRGGIELTSPSKDFGGISAIRLTADGARFIAVTDKGRWLRGRILYRDNAPIGLDEVEMAPVLGPDGRPITARGWYDTEAIAEDGGTLYLALERVHQILRFDYGKDGLRARGQPIAVPPAMKKLPSNKGIEGLVFIPRGTPLGGSLLAFSERGLDHAGNLLAFIIGGPTPGTFTIRRSGDFDIGDAALLPPDDLLLLERKFSFLSGVAIRIRRIPLAGLHPGAMIDGRTLLEADMGYQIDNMEGLAVHRTAAGETVLTLISDDNFSPMQRTVLLQFTLLVR